MPPVILVLCTHVQFSLLCLCLGPIPISPPPPLPSPGCSHQRLPAALALPAGLGQLDPSQLRPLNPLLLPLGAAVEIPAPSSCSGTLLQKPRNYRVLGRGRLGSCPGVGRDTSQQPCLGALPSDFSLCCLHFPPLQAWGAVCGVGKQRPQNYRLQCRKRPLRLLISEAYFIQGYTEAQRSDMTCPSTHSQ